MGQVRLPSKDSAVARSVRVLGYTVGAVFLSWLIDPKTTEAIAEYYPQIASAIIIGTPVISLVVNVLRKDVDNI